MIPTFLFNEWWFWIFVVIPLTALSIGMVAVLGDTVVKVVSVVRGETKDVKALRREVARLHEQLSQSRQDTLPPQRELTPQDLREIEQQTLPEGVTVFLFTDIEGFTRLLDRHGDEAAFELVQRHNRVLRRAAESHGGSEIKQLGDGFIFCFSSARKALLCAGEAQRELAQLASDEGKRLRVRMGLHAGEPIQSERDYIGQTVNLAQRVMQQADGGQVFCSEVVRNLAGALKGYQFVDRGQRRLDGIREPQRLYAFQPVEALSHPLDSAVERELDHMERRLEDPPR